MLNHPARQQLKQSNDRHSLPTAVSSPARSAAPWHRGACCPRVPGRLPGSHSRTAAVQCRTPDPSLVRPQPWRGRGRERPDSSQSPILRIAVLDAMHALHPARWHARRFRPNTLGVVAVGFVELRAFADGAVDSVGQLWCLQGIDVRFHGHREHVPRWPPQTAPLLASQTAPGRTVGL